MSGANARVKRFHAIFSGESAHPGQSNVLSALRLLALGAAVAGLATFGCGEHATLNVTAPPGAVAGAPFTVTVTATVGKSPDRVINSAIHFTSSDSAAVLPADYRFTPNDAGSHTFTNGVTLMTAGSQTVTATDIEVTALTATAHVTVFATAAATTTQLR